MPYTLSFSSEMASINSSVAKNDYLSMPLVVLLSKT